MYCGNAVVFNQEQIAVCCEQMGKKLKKILKNIAWYQANLPCWVFLNNWFLNFLAALTQSIIE